MSVELLNKMEEICVMMSSYNGEKYIDKQIKSILSQRNVRVTLIIRDDGSSDQTVNIIKLYKDIILLEGENVGVTNSFYKLMKYVLKNGPQYAFYAFADQDDVWLPNKLSVAIRVLLADDVNVPNLYYSNLKCVNNDLGYLYDRFKAGYVNNSKKQVLSEICALGCTCVFNYKTLEEMAKLDESYYDYHDNWILWIAKFLGNCHYDENSYILYRQHGDNASGSVHKGMKYLFYQLKRFFNVKNMTSSYEQRAKKFLELYRKNMNDTDIRMMEHIAYYKDKSIYKLRLLFTNYITSGHIIKELGRRVRIISNKL